jgi:hypothetical protein
MSSCVLSANLDQNVARETFWFPSRDAFVNRRLVLFGCACAANGIAATATSWMAAAKSMLEASITIIASPSSRARDPRRALSLAASGDAMRSALREPLVPSRRLIDAFGYGILYRRPFNATQSAHRRRGKRKRIAPQ